MQMFNLRVDDVLILMTPNGPVKVKLTCIKRSEHGYEKKVRIGIEADRSIPVHRQEIFDIIKRDQEKAALRAPIDVNRNRPE